MGELASSLAVSCWLTVNHHIRHYDSRHLTSIRHEIGDEFGNRNIGRSPMFEAADRNGGSAKGVSPLAREFLFNLEHRRHDLTAFQPRPLPSRTIQIHVHARVHVKARHLRTQLFEFSNRNSGKNRKIFMPAFDMIPRDLGPMCKTS